MKRYALMGLFALAFAALAAPPAAEAQLGAQVRGTVVDEQGAPVPDVNVELQFSGDGQKRTYNLKTNKKGGFVRVGLPGGSYKLFFTKEGYVRYGLDTWLSGSGLSEICLNQPRPGEPCKDIVLKKLPPGAAVAGAPAAGQAGQPAQPGAADQAAMAMAAEDAKKLGETYSQAIEALKAKSWDEAEILLKQVVEKVPNQPQVHFNLGFVQRQKKDYAGAEAEFRKAAELQPEKAEPFIALANLYAETGKAEQAAEYLGGAQANFQQNAAFLTAYGAMAMNAGKEKEAEEAFTKVLALEPANYQVRFHLATLALNRSETDGAIQHLEAYVAAAPADGGETQVAKDLLAALKAKKK